MGGAFSSSSGASSSSTKKKPPAAISQVDRAVLDLKNARDRLSKYKKKLEQDEGKIVSKAKAAKQAGQTKTALNLLRLRKIKTREVESVEGQLLTIFQMVQTIDSKQNESQVLEAMAKGKDALKKMHEETTVDHVLELMDQISEQNEVEREISGILEGKEHLSVEDEAAVEAELEALMMQEIPTVELPTVPVTKPLPTAPITKLPEATAEVEKRVAVPS
jgi:hypothetical protein